MKRRGIILLCALATVGPGQMRTNSAPLLTELRRQMHDTNPAVVLTASNALHLLQLPNP